MYPLTRLRDENQTQNVKGHLKVSQREASLRERVPHGGSGATGLGGEGTCVLPWLLRVEERIGQGWAHLWA